MPRDSGTLDIVGMEIPAFIATYHSRQQSKKGRVSSMYKEECNLFLLCSGQLDEVPVRDGTPRRKSSSTFNLNPLAKDFTIGKPLAKNFTNGQPIANDFVLAKPPKLWTPSGKDASPTYSSPPPFIPFTFSSPPPSPPLSFSFETLSVNMNTSVPPPMPKKSFYSTFTPANSNPTMVSQFEGMMRDWGSYGGRAAFN